MAGPLIRNQVTLDGSILAVTYKLNVSNVPKMEAMHYMLHSHDRVKDRYARLRGLARKEQYLTLENHITDLLMAERQSRASELREPQVADAPIARALDSVPGWQSTRIWYGYQVDLVTDQGLERDLLQLRAKADFVVRVQWRGLGQADIYLTDTPTKFSVAPLRSVPGNQQDDEIQVGDLALLVGKYMIVAHPPRVGDDSPCIMVNWLEIQETLTEETSRRGRRSQTVEELPVTKFF